MPSSKLPTSINWGFDRLGSSVRRCMTTRWSVAWSRRSIVVLRPSRTAKRRCERWVWTSLSYAATRKYAFPKAWVSPSSSTLLPNHTSSQPSASIAKLITLIFDHRQSNTIGLKKWNLSRPSSQLFHWFLIWSFYFWLIYYESRSQLNSPGFHWQLLQTSWFQGQGTEEDVAEGWACR